MSRTVTIRTESENASSTTPNTSAGITVNESETDDEQEENLVYLVSNILFTILWRGVENTDAAWQVNLVKTIYGLIIYYQFLYSFISGAWSSDGVY